MIRLWLSKVWPYIAAIGAAFAAALAIRQSGKAAGRHEAQQAVADESKRKREIARDVDQNMDSLDADAARNAANRWVRGPGK